MCSVNIDKLRTLIYTQEFKAEVKYFLDRSLDKISKIEDDTEKIKSYADLLKQIQKFLTI